MRRFIKNIVFISILIFSFYSLVIFISYLIERKYNENINTNRIPIIGHSYVEFGLNDSLLTEKIGVKFDNYGRGGQSLFWSLISLKKHKIQGADNFIILISNNSYTTGWKTFDIDRGARETYLKNFLNIDDYQYLFKENFSFALRTLFKIHWPTRNIDGKFIKGYRPFEKKIALENLNTAFDYDDDALHRFIRSNNSLNFIIIRTPLHSEAFENIYNESFFLQKFNDFRKYNNTTVIDFGHIFKNFQVEEDLLFMDYDHLNFKGANIFTDIFTDSLLKKNYFNKLIIE